MILLGNPNGSFIRIWPNPAVTIGRVHWCAFGGLGDRKRYRKHVRQFERKGWKKQLDPDGFHRWYAPGAPGRREE